MLQGVRIYTSDGTWRKVFDDLGATVLDAPSPTDINFDLLNIALPVTLMELKSIILRAADNTDVFLHVFGKHVKLPRIQGQIVELLYKTGGMNAAQLKDALGYSPSAATHAVDTAIYQLRRTYGREFIQNNDGVYRLGKI